MRNNPRCGGISINGEDPKCCEVHLLPWGHDRKDHGILGNTVIDISARRLLPRLPTFKGWST